MKLYVDLDSVLTDFAKALSEMFDMKVDPLKHIEFSREMWKKIDDAGEPFWANMEWFPGGKELWGEVKKYDPTILSSPSRHETSKAGKRTWVKDNLGPDVPVILETKKEIYSSPGAILIDDSKKNIDRWIEAGGKGILHRDVKKTLKKLKDIMETSKEASKIERVKSPSDPSKVIIIEKLRGGRGTEIMKDKKKYNRKSSKKWKESFASCTHVVLSYLSRKGSVDHMVLEVADDLQADVEKLKNTVNQIKQKDPQGAERLIAVHRLETIFQDFNYMISNIRKGDHKEIARIDYKIDELKKVLKGYPGVENLLDKKAYDAFKFKSHPIVIDPYDAIVQQACREMGPASKNIDVIKLEPTCPGDKVAWVSNQDLLEGEEGKQRVIHLCLKKIKDEFKKAHGKNYSMTTAEDSKRMKNVILTYLKDVILRHEGSHIDQEIKGRGQFGPSPEVGAERAEDWSNLEQMGIRKKAGFFPDDYDPDTGKFVGKLTPIRSDRPVRRDPPFSFKRLRTENINNVRRILLGMKDQKATKIWDYIENALMGDYSKEQEEDLKKIIQEEAREHSLSVGELVNNLLGNKPVIEHKPSPVYQGVSRKFAHDVVVRYASQNEVARNALTEINNAI